MGGICVTRTQNTFLIRIEDSNCSHHFGIFILNLALYLVLQFTYTQQVYKIFFNYICSIYLYNAIQYTISKQNKISTIAFNSYIPFQLNITSNIVIQIYFYDVGNDFLFLILIYL